MIVVTGSPGVAFVSRYLSKLNKPRNTLFLSAMGTFECPCFSTSLTTSSIVAFSRTVIGSSTNPISYPFIFSIISTCSLIDNLAGRTPSPPSFPRAKAISYPVTDVIAALKNGKFSLSFPRLVLRLIFCRVQSLEV